MKYINLHQHAGSLGLFIKTETEIGDGRDARDLIIEKYTPNRPYQKVFLFHEEGQFEVERIEHFQGTHTAHIFSTKGTEHVYKCDEDFQLMIFDHTETL